MRSAGGFKFLNYQISQLLNRLRTRNYKISNTRITIHLSWQTQRTLSKEERKKTKRASRKKRKTDNPLKPREYARGSAKRKVKKLARGQAKRGKK